MLRTLFTVALVLFATTLSAQDWREIRGGYRGEIAGVAVTAAGQIVHGTWGHALFQSSDGGATWERGRIGRESIASAMSLAVSSIVADERPGEILATSSRSIFRSTDGGATWTLHRTGIEDGARNTNITSIIRLDDDATLVGTGSSFWRSNGGLAGYTRVDPNDFAYVTTAFVRVGDAIVAGSDSGLYRFDASGAVVAKARRQGLHNGAVVRALAASGGALFAGTEAGLYRSSDVGASWGTRQLADQYIRAVLPLSGGVIIAATHNGILRSVDDGATWTSPVPELVGRYATALARRSDGLLVAGTALGIYVSSDGGATWSSRANGIENTTISDVLGLDSAVVLVRLWGAKVGLYRSTNAGLSWSPVGEFTDITVNGFTRSFDGVVVAATSRGVYLSSDGGASWSATSRDSASRAAASGPNRRMLASGANNDSLYLSRDGGSTWSAMQPRGNFYWLAIGSGGEFYAAEQSGFHVSTDDGATWRRPAIRGSSVGTFAIDRMEHLYLGTEAGLLRSTDRGATFTRVESAPVDTYVDVLTTSPDGHVTIATSFIVNSIRRSVDGGATFEPVAHDFPVIGTFALSYDAAGYLYTMVKASGTEYLMRTERAHVPGVRTPIFPADGAAGLPPMLTLQWGDVAGASRYHVQVSDDPTIGRANRTGSSLHGATLRIDDSTVSAPSYPLSDLTPGETWYWRVRAKRNDAWDMWSPTFRFTTAGGPSGVERERANDALKLTPRYRNGSVELELTLAALSHVHLALYALDGSHVATLVAGTVPAGTRSVVLARGDVPTGAYIAVCEGAGTRTSRGVVIQ
jgi:ligand-binding sensor domain-containing protein